MPASKTRRKRAGGRSTTRLGPQTTAASDAAMRPLELAPHKSAAIRGSKVGATLLLIGSLMMVYAFLTGSRFMVSHVSVEGAHLATEDQVRQAADVDFANLFQVNPRRLEERLVAELGCVATARVRCRLPNRVEIRLVEFKAPVVWESSGNLWWIDANGKVLGRASDPGARLVIHDLQALASEPQGHIVGVPWEMVADIARLLPAAAEIDYDQAHGLILRITAAKWPVYLGHTGAAQRKVAIMQDLVDRLTRDGTQVAYIDLRDEGRPVFKAQ